jgi:hypothetical protein
MKSEWQEAAFIVMMTSVFNRNRWQERLLAKLRVLDIIGNLICHSENKPKDSALDRRPFCDRRYDTVFVYHNGAESYYAARGFRGALGSKF